MNQKAQVEQRWDLYDPYEEEDGHQRQNARLWVEQQIGPQHAGNGAARPDRRNLRGAVG